MKYYVYVTSSLKIKYLYIGHTNNIERRLKEHNSAKTPSNKKYAPFKLVLIEEFESRKEAIDREKELKKGYNRGKLRDQFY